APVAVAVSQEFVSAPLDTTYEGALSARNQLALGAIKLDGTPNALNVKQAAALLPLWQALRSANQSGSAQAEVTALLTQIEQTMTPTQLQAIKAMKLTQTEFQDWAKANGITLGSGAEGGIPGASGGAGLSASEKATRQATRASSSGASASTAVVDAVIKYLGSIK
ncbi:MAG: hypothetical protein HZB52_13795, partial [Chloroflexi bacterium]|nr:hypothetical protein [Chloroflexota bacterium]